MPSLAHLPRGHTDPVALMPTPHVGSCDTLVSLTLVLSSALVGSLATGTSPWTGTCRASILEPGEPGFEPQLCQFLAV